MLSESKNFMDTLVTPEHRNQQLIEGIPDEMQAAQQVQENQKEAKEPKQLIKSKIQKVKKSIGGQLIYHTAIIIALIIIGQFIIYRNDKAERKKIQTQVEQLMGEKHKLELENQHQKIIYSQDIKQNQQQNEQLQNYIKDLEVKLLNEQQSFQKLEKALVDNQVKISKMCSIIQDKCFKKNILTLLNKNCEESEIRIYNEICLV